MRHGIFEFSPHFVSGLNTSIIPIGAYTIVYILGGEWAVRILNYLLFYLAFLLIEKFCTKRFGKRPACYATVFAISTPYLLWCIGVVFIDSFNFISVSILIVEVALLFEKPLSAKTTCYISLLAALAFLCKQQGVTVILPTALILAFWLLQGSYRGRTLRPIYYGLFGAACFLLLIAPPLAVNYHISGNPFYPFYNKFFQSPFFLFQNFKDMRWLHNPNYRTLWDLTFHGSSFVENIDFAFGFSYFVFLWFALPAVLFYSKQKQRSDLLILSLIFALFHLLTWLTTGFYMRYFVGSILPGSIILGLGIDRLLTIAANPFALSILSRMAVWVVIMLNFAAQLSIRNMTDPYPLREAFIHDYTHSTASVYEKQKELFAYARLRYGDKAKGLLVDTPSLYLAQGPVESLSWVFPTTQQAISNAKTASELYQTVFHHLGFKYLIMPKHSKAVIFSSREFQRNLRVKFARNEWQLLEPGKDSNR